MLLGAPVLPATVNGDDWINATKKLIGDPARNIEFNVATMTTSYSGTPGVPAGGYTPSWNHSKLIVVDGQTVITGGVNTYTDNYVQTPKPVTDMMMAIRGPAAASATAYINRLWEWTCANRNKRNWLAVTGSWVYPSDKGCMSLLRPPPASEAGDLDMLEVGGLGVGIQGKDASSTYKLPDLKRPEDAKCKLSYADKDVVDLDRDYQTVNPEEAALREMVAAATYDWKRFLPPTVQSVQTERTKNAKRVKVTVQAGTHSGDDFMVAHGNKIECRHTKSGKRCSFEDDASIVGKKIDIIDEKTLRWTQREVPRP